MQRLLSDPYSLLAIILLVAGCTLGVVFERVVMGRLRYLAQRSASLLDDIVLDALKGVTMAGFSLLGFYGAIVTLGTSPLRNPLNKLLLIVTVAYCTMVVARFAVAYINHYARQAQGVLPTTSIFSNLARAVIYVLGLVVILDSLNYKITPILTALGVGGLAVALALQDTLSNLFSGLQIIGSRQVRPGDFIQLESGEEGYVIDVTWRNTTIREPANNTIIVPNSKLASSRVRNFYQPDRELAVTVEVGVSYDSDLDHVERVTMEVAREIMNTVPGGVADAEPGVQFTKFGDSSINVVAVLRGKEAAYRGALRHAFMKRLHERFKQEGIEIPFPVRTVYMKQSP
jgi:small-conductance mechanosensitive channel